MIKEIKLTNFYSFKQETIMLQPDVNVLVGINGSGKSNFFKAVRLLYEGIGGTGLRKHILEDLGGFDNIYFKQSKNDEPNIIELEYIFDGEAIYNTVGKGDWFHFKDDIRYKIRIIKSNSFQNYYIEELIETSTPKEGFNTGFTYLQFSNGIGVMLERSSNRDFMQIKYTNFNPQELVLKEISDTDRYLAVATLRKAIKEIVVYNYFDTTANSKIRKPMLPTSEIRLMPDGTNLPQILNTLKINYKTNFKTIINYLNEINEKILNIDFNLIGGNIELMLEEDKLDSSIHVSNISDGTLRYLCLLSIFCNPQRGSFICIDEPEAGLHPDMILNVSKAINEATIVSTVVVATHSDSLLNCFYLENIRVFEKNDANATKISTFSKSDFEGWYENFNPGSLWRAGDIGGNRW